MSDHNEQITDTAAHIVGHSVSTPKRQPVLVLLLLLTKKVSMSTSGRDVLLKVPQYFAALVLYIYSQQSKTEALTRLGNMRASFSITRRLLRLGHAVHPLSSILELVSDLMKRPEDLKKLETVHSVDDFARLMAVFQLFLGLANDISDDLGALTHIGVLRVPMADYFSMRLWAIGNAIDQVETYELSARMETRVRMLQEAGEVKKAKALSAELFMARVLQLQLFADAVFLACDISPDLISKTVSAVLPSVDGKRQVPGVAAAAGLVSGLCGMYRAYARARD